MANMLRKYSIRCIINVNSERSGGFMNDNIDRLRKKANSLPLLPGVYLMKNKEGKIIYIGKAKALKNRVTSYFRSNASHNEKVRKMVSKVYDFDFIVTTSEFEALVLECSLIKQNKPKYNILLKDDKGYSYIKISNEEYPRITAEFKNNEKGARYIGPYTSSYAVKTAVDEVNTVFRLPTCARKFPRDFGKHRPCLNRHINKCMGLCEGNISADEYNALIENAVDYLEGNGDKTIERLTELMYDASEKLRFEEAGRYRDRIKAIQGTLSKQRVVKSDGRNYDVIGMAKNNDLASIAVLKYRKGVLADKQNFFLGEWYDENELRSDFIKSYYTSVGDAPEEIITDGGVEDSELLCELIGKTANRRVRISPAKRGERLNLTMLAKANASEYLALKVGRTSKELAALEELRNILGLSKTPNLIEAYDISNHGDSGMVAGMVVFENGRPKKRAYKRFSIKTLSGQDDYGAMREVLTRRLTRYKNGDEGFDELPDLILLDGGKGHVSTVSAVLDELGISVPLFGMVKDNRHRTRAVTDAGKETAISKNRLAFTLVSNIQDEVHRYSVAYHNTKERQKSLKLELTNVKGIGEKKALKLIQHYKTKSKLKEAKVEELRDVAGVNYETATNLKQYIAEFF